MALINDANRRWWTLGGTCLGLFLLMLDSTVVTLALPAIQGDLDASSAELQWVVNGYLLAMAALVVTIGRLGDQFGRRRIFEIEMVLFLVGSIVSAVSPTPEVLIAGRFIQGVAGAGLLALSLALVSNAFSDADRPKALGIWAAVSSIALGVGPIIGGFLISELSWRWIFFINIPFVVLGIVMTRLSTAEARDESASTKIDVPGVVTLSLALGALVLGLVQAPQWGWTAPATLGLLIGGVVLLLVFSVIEERVSNPIVEFDLFRNRPYLGANAAAFGIVAAYWSLTFFQPQYLQNILDMSPLVAGLAFLPMVAPMIVISPLCGHLLARFGVRSVMTVGMTLAVAGLVVLTQVDASSDYLSVFPGYLLVGIALGLVYAPMSTAAMAAMPRAKAGIAAGVLASNRLMAGAVGLAVVGALFQTLSHDKVKQLTNAAGASLGDDDVQELDGLLSGAPSAKAVLARADPSLADSIAYAVRDAFTFGLSNATWVLVGVTAVCTVLTWLLVRSTPAGPKPNVAPPDPTADPSDHPHPVLSVASHLHLHSEARRRAKTAAARRE